jgi:DNA ligase (NAD+)
MGISKIGSMAKDVVKIAPTIKELDNLTVEKLLTIDGFAVIKAQCFVDGWKIIKKDVDKILENINIKEEEMSTKSKKLDGKSFCITGTLSQPRNAFQALIEENGGRFASSVSSKLDFLICGEDCGGKRDKAEAAGVKIISEEEFMEMI